MSQMLHIADLFCGAGGTSTGAVEAAQTLGLSPRLTAVNHWPIAVQTHEMNHPGARHFCASLDALNPRELFKPGELDLLWASPECTHHSIARGGKPINEQSRATAWCVVRWADALQPPVIMIENVPEFLGWGGIGADGRPMKSKKGATFAAWVSALESLGYRVKWRILCAADYGDPTTRRRLFVQAVRGRRRIVWPDPTHAEDVTAGLFECSRKPWVPAREIIDWSMAGESIFARKRPLSEKTLARIWTGLRRFGMGAHLQAMEHKGHVRGLDRPLNTVTTAKGGAHALVEPFLVEMRGTSARQCEQTARDLSEPLTTVSTSGAHHALIEPHLLPQHGCGALRPVSQPVPTVACAGAVALVEPFLVEYYGNGRAQSVGCPLGTATTKQRFALVQPEVMLEGKRYLLDIRFRMLQPHELAAAQGFPRDYKFAGTKTEAVRQIGNAVPRGLARALVLAAFAQDPSASGLWKEAA